MPLPFLRNVQLFDCLEDDQIRALSNLTFTRKFSKGAIIILAQEEGDTLFIIEKGQAKVSLYHEDGRELILSVLGEGDVFGELALLDGRPRSANVLAMRDTQLLMLRRHDLLQLITEVPQIGVALLEELATRLRRSDGQVEGLALLSVANRVAKTLLLLATDHGVVKPQGILLRDRPTHQHLANMTGTTRETVTRVLKQLEEQGYIAVNGREILILKENPDEF